jgi:cell division protein FtsZ
MPEVKPSDIQSFASIKVVGVGGAGGSAINRMKEAGLSGVQFIAVNTDAQALHNSKADVKVHIGRDTTRGLGAGADPSTGEAAANESREELKNVLEGADLIFVTIGAGGGTGSGAGHVVAEVARELGILVIGVATKPFSFEGEKRRQNAEWAIAQLGRQVDTLITIVLLSLKPLRLLMTCFVRVYRVSQSLLPNTDSSTSTSLTFELL